MCINSETKESVKSGTSSNDLSVHQNPEEGGNVPEEEVPAEGEEVIEADIPEAEVEVEATPEGDAQVEGI